MTAGPYLAILLAAGSLLAQIPHDTRVADAVEGRKIEEVHTLLKAKADVNGAQGDGSTALHWAAFNDDLEIARELLAAGANPKAVTRVGAITPFLMAAKNGDGPMLEILIKAGADPKSANQQGTTALMMAAAAGNTDAVKLLLDQGSDVNARENAHGQTALMFGAALNRAAAVKLLLAHGADPNVTTKLTKFERIRVDIDGNPIPPEGQKPRTITTTPAPDEALPALPASADASTQLTQLQALVKQLTARLDQLEHPAPKIEKAEETPRGNGGKAGDVAFLGPREVGSTLSGGMSALLFAARDGQFEAVKELVEGSANINQVAQSDRSSPLVTAIVNGHFNIAKYLLDHGAATNLSTSAGLTPLIATIDVQWAPHAWFPQPNMSQEKVSYLDLLTRISHAV